MRFRDLDAEIERVVERRMVERELVRGERARLPIRELCRDDEECGTSMER